MFCSKIEISETDFLKLKNEIEKSKFVEVESYTEQMNTDIIFSKIKNSEIENIYRLRTSFDEYFIILLSDKKTITIFYRSW